MCDSRQCQTNAQENMFSSELHISSTSFCPCLEAPQSYVVTVLAHAEKRREVVM
jgi:hypothetical protein